ncbi:hypothetical protein CANCADRAFT_55935 [Tortispora caseinolytica NRRL Y-17796]|uniref:Uncharacterized protein n=1 Tax=Tortispora caseinolytica NRRL Y-17796 TaxID=767744 RepID=A0A1E4TKD3_9ASCO|nr:hypothetical protein CANCADRAFT_55935 [Tortispora caseinolytica NRRL Y-17796]
MTWVLLLIACYVSALESITYRPLQWQQLNFLHTTDTHGWLAGHLNPTYGADWGDYLSFVSHMRNYSDENNMDLIVVDTGDYHDGTGISDITNPRGRELLPIMRELDVDLITLGNHELYVGAITIDTVKQMADYYGEKFIIANVEIWDEEKNDYVTFAPRYRRFTTPKNGLNVLALGFMFDFTGNSNISRLTPVEESVQQEWFFQAMTAAPFPDVILVVTHIPIRDTNEIDALHKAVREYYPDTPIQIFGGHSHIRDYVVLDDNATALESGRYGETLGFASIGGFESYDYSFERRYIDFSKKSFYYHSNKTEDNFMTEQGLRVREQLTNLSNTYNLSDVYGYVPNDYYLAQTPYASNNSLLTLVENKILPRLKGTVGRDDKPRMIIVNSGAFRYHLEAGNYTLDTQFQIAPFDTYWIYFKDLPVRLARIVVPLLNGVPENIHANREKFTRDLADSNAEGSTRMTGKRPKGYVTCDDYGCDGDDVYHSGGKIHPLPNVITSVQNLDSDLNLVTETDTIDLVSLKFVAPFIQAVLPNTTALTYEEYGGIMLRELITEYVVENWGNKVV